MALKSTEEERAILRARSAVQRFPVVEWRQRMEDFHKRSINTSRHNAQSNAWRPSDGETEPAMRAVAMDNEDWDPVHQAEPTQPNWDSRSVMSIPASPGWSQSSGHDQGLLAPPRVLMSDEFGRRGSVSSDASEADDYFTARTRNGGAEDSRPDSGFDNFLAKANRTIAKDKKHAPDPFVDGGDPSALQKPFANHNRISSVESIASIVDEKSASPLNKAIASVRDFFVYCH